MLLYIALKARKELDLAKYHLDVRLLNEYTPR